MAARPKTLFASISPVLLGLSLALKERSINSLTISTIVVITICAILIQILSNYVNDLWDYYKGADGEFRKGPQRVVSSGIISPQKMKTSIVVLTILIIALGSYLCIQGGLPILLIGICSIIGAYAYTSGPYPLAYNALGEVFVFIFFGPIPIFGTYYLLTGIYSSLAIAVGTIPGLIASAILLVNNIRDIEEDQENNKNTLSVLCGKELSLSAFSICIFLPYLIVAYLSISSLPAIIRWIYLLIPLSIWIRRLLILAERGEDYNRVLGLVGAYLFIFSLTLSTLIQL